MGQRGRVIVYQPDGKGTVTVSGAMLAFDTARHWRSPNAPKVNDAVDVELNADGNLQSVTLVPLQKVAQEHAGRVSALGQAKGREIWADAKASLGLPVLVALMVLVVAAFVLNTININIYGEVSLSYWQLLGLNSSTIESMGESGGGLTLARFLFLLCVLACVATRFIRKPLASLGKCLPLVFILVHTIISYVQVSNGLNEAGKMARSFGGSQAASMSRKMADQMLTQLMEAFSLGFGLYLLLGAAVVLAILGMREWRRAAR